MLRADGINLVMWMGIILRRFFVGIITVFQCIAFCVEVRGFVALTSHFELINFLVECHRVFYAEYFN